MLFYLLQLAYDGGISRQYSMLLHTGLLVIVIFSTLFLLPKQKITNTLIKQEKSKREITEGITNKAFKSDSECREKSALNGHNRGNDMNQLLESYESSTEYDDRRPDISPLESHIERNNTQHLYTQVNNMLSKYGTIHTQTGAKESGHIDDHSASQLEQSENSGNEKKEKSVFLKSMLTQEYMLHLMWFGFLHLRLQLFLGSFNTWVTEVVQGDDKQGNDPYVYVRNS